MTTRRAVLAAALAAALAIPALPAAAQIGSTVEEIAAYDQPDRDQKLYEAAKKEGSLTIYTSAQVKDMGAIAKAFEAKYPGVKVEIWRASSEKVLQRAITEARAGRNTMDVAETNGPELESMHREKICQAMKSPYQKDLIPEALPAHHEWTGTRLNVFVQAYNTNAVKKADLPKSWEDLADPKWKDKIGIEQADYDWLSGEASALGEQKAAAVFKKMVDTNGISVRKGHTLLTQLVVSGEVPLALTVYNYKAEQFKKKGAPIDWFSIGPAIARPNGIAVAKKAPHPHAAVLFYDFEISPDGQKILAKRNFVTTNRKVHTKLGDIPMKFVEVNEMLDHYDHWEKLYTQLFSGKSK
ncbi:MAG TPA: extracellular solute-binding protein [Usitatibacter sp.]|nr:extracellular solute-binding protein [Usitatibacter sp.]